MLGPLPGEGLSYLPSRRLPPSSRSGHKCQALQETPQLSRGGRAGELLWTGRDSCGSGQSPWGRAWGWGAEEGSLHRIFGTANLPSQQMDTDRAAGECCASEVSGAGQGRAGHSSRCPERSLGWELESWGPGPSSAMTQRCLFVSHLNHICQNGGKAAGFSRGVHKRENLPTHARESRTRWQGGTGGSAWSWGPASFLGS